MALHRTALPLFKQVGVKTNSHLQNTQKEGERKNLLGAEQNYYKQLYLEDTGKPGDLRISEVTFGDPAAQGSVFVHERI